MRRLLDDAVFRDELGASGYAAYRTQWTTDAYLERYLGLVDRLGESKRTGRPA